MGDEKSRLNDALRSSRGATNAQWFKTSEIGEEMIERLSGYLSADRKIEDTAWRLQISIFTTEYVLVWSTEQTLGTKIGQDDRPYKYIVVSRSSK